MATQSLKGHYTVKYYRVGTPLLDEQVFGGNAILTEHHMVSFSRLTEGPFGYSGSYRVQGERLLVNVSCCTAPDIEGQTFDWKIDWVNDSDLKLSGTEISTGRPFEMMATRTES